MERERRRRRKRNGKENDMKNEGTEIVKRIGEEREEMT